MDLFFVLWVFVIENLNKGNINMEINVYDVFMDDFALLWSTVQGKISDNTLVACSA